MAGDVESPLVTTTHTPGPWTVRRGVCRQDHPDTSADVQGRDGQFVADCGCHEQANANARLIAASPDLLEALKGYRHSLDVDHISCMRFEREGSDNVDVEVVDNRCAVCRAADAAIQKAEGR